MMRPVTIYTTTYCPYCVSAKKILSDHQVPFTEIDVTGDDDKRRWLVQASGQRTVPQIFFGDDSIGGCSDLQAVVKQGRLQTLLADGLPKQEP
jgi:glutaredoxin 3